MRDGGGREEGRSKTKPGRCRMGGSHNGFHCIICDDVLALVSQEGMKFWGDASWWEDDGSVRHTSHEA